MGVTIYTTPTCPHCHKAKEYLKEKDIKFQEIDVSIDHEKAQEMTQKSGQMGVPVLAIDGKIIVGFNKNKIDEAIA